MEKVPVTLLTGYLGAGKTTLVNHILKHPTGRRIALVVNNLGSVNVDARLLKSNGVKYEKNQLMELTNGCICSVSGKILSEGLKNWRWTASLI